VFFAFDTICGVGCLLRPSTIFGFDVAGALSTQMSAGQGQTGDSFFTLYTFDIKRK
jgi:hypothetical protein